MDYKKIRTDSEAVTRKMADFNEGTENLYETIAILSKRANQISQDIKKELQQKIEEFTSPSDNLEEVFENREQIEIARFYERLPKPTLLSVQEFLNNDIYYRNPHKETSTDGF